ncbi:hypothetical protein Tco_1015296 [Tanacetum coccineum]|uniref:Uncharacterized protein n=1 Tax=Tanacetum coccineum TaxID=301880 RepID=A0ABQ5FKC7_9ASTR
MASQFPLTPSKLERDDITIFCDDVKYVPGYTCSGQLYSLIVLADNDDDEEEFLDADETLVDTMTEEVQPQISLNALYSVSLFQTIKVIRLVAKQHELHILADSGSTHNFLDMNAAKRME